jgi:ATP-dependent Clp protease ATP-binding subunit ClpB
VNFDFLSPEGKRALVAAQRLARTRDEEAVELEHLLVALTETPETAEPLRRLGVDLPALRRRCEQVMAAFPKVPGGKVYLGDRVLRALDIAQGDAQERGDGAVGPLHLLLALPLDPGGPAADLLREHGLTLGKLETLRPRARAAGAPPAAPSTPARGAAPELPLLSKYARDLTALAEAGALDPVVGRDDEIRRLMQILGRRTKNNPILVGDPGVGKTAIVEALAQRIVADDVPRSLAGKRIYAFDVGALVAGARFRGEFEDRVRGVLQELREAGGGVLIFFDEIHTLVGAGKGEGSIDAASLLKPALARGELTCIGATTVDEYRLHIEKDPAFERRFQPVLVNEPPEEECLAMLRALKARYEERHHVRIQDSALVAAVKLSRRYVADRSLPDKAIDLLDEASSRLRLELDSHPDEVDALERRERSLRVELEALGREREAEAVARRGALEEQLAGLRARLQPLREKWQAELEAITAVGAAGEAVEHARRDAAALERAGELGRAAELRYGKLPALEQALAAAEARLQEVQGPERLLEDAVEPVHVARVVADWTGIPVAKMLEGERQKVLAIEARLGERVVGQDEAVRLVGHAVKRARAGLSDASRPIGSFLFLGPTGVGKTELTKALAEFLFDDDHALVRLDMSEYMEKHAVARLTGAPPGYVGYEEGGQLTEAVRRRPFSVVLFDEVEKAHPDVFNVLLALLDDGRLTDSRGRTVGFSNTVLIMTSNLGSHAILAAAETGDRAGVVHGHFRPEFLNRIDETVIFNPLGRREIEAIVGLQLRRLDRLLGEQKLSLSLDAEARALLVEESYDPAFGARPVKRCLQRRLRDPLSEALLAGTFAPGDVVRVTRRGGDLVFEKTPAAGEG